MPKKLWLLVGLFLLSACTTTTPTILEPTVIAPSKTLQVTQTPFSTLTATPKVKIPTLTPIPSELVGLDSAYFDGVVLIARYLIFLDLGVYDQAYQLLHSIKQNAQSQSDFVFDAEKAYKSVQIKSILPYPVWTAIHTDISYTEPANLRRFVVEFHVEGEPGWWEANDIKRVYYLKEENGEWRIYDEQGEISEKYPQTPPVRIDPVYFDGMIAIAKYYTYLDKGLFTEAFSLLSSKAQGRRSMEEYVKMSTLAFRMVEIKTIEPYFYFAQQHNWRTTPEKGVSRQFFIEIIAEGEGGMSGSYPNGVIQSFNITLIQENSEWRIDKFGI